MAGETGLVDIKRLVLSDTFNTWFDTTNQIIDAIDPLAIYDIEGMTGINIISGTTGSVYNGTKYIGINAGHGIGFYGASAGAVNAKNEIALNFGGLSDGSGSMIVATGDYFIFADISDNSGLTGGTIKKVRAINMLPAVINAPSGPNGTITLEGNLTVNGSLFVGGNNSFIASNDLRIEDRILELAYQVGSTIGLTGITAGSYPVVGTKAFYYDVGATAFGSTAFATVIGAVKSITGPEFGPTAEVRIGSMIIKGGPELFTVGGFVRFEDTNTGNPTGASYGVVAAYGDVASHFPVKGITNDFLDDVTLHGAGIVIKGGLSGDKSFTWDYYSQTLRSNVSLGVNDELEFINARNFRNKGLTTDSKNLFIFQGIADNVDNTRVRLTYDNAGYWEFEQDKSVAGNNPLNINYVNTIGGSAFNITSIKGLTSGPLGITGFGSTAAPIMWAQKFNADMLDGAHGTYASSPYSIPVSDNRGRINSNWLEASSNRAKITQANHPFTVGSVASMSGGSYVLGNAGIWTSSAAEAVGIVETVIDSNNFVLVSNGYVSGIPVSSIGTVYFLSPTVSGGLTFTSPTTYNNVRKAMFYSTVVAGGSASGYVLSHPGQIVGAGETATDLVYLEGLIPVGTIQPYAGSFTGGQYNTNSWIPCDGRALQYQSFVDLYNSIGNLYYARGIVTSTQGSAPVITVERNIRELSETDIIRIVFDNGTITGGTGWDAAVFAVDSGASTVTLTGDSGSPSWSSIGIASGNPVRIYGKIDTTRPGVSTFFVPDLRTRISIGSVTGEAQGSLGQTYFTNSGWATEGANISGFGVTGGTGATGGGFVAINYLIRAQKTTSAVVLTGHHHDDRYMLRNTGTVHISGGITFSGGPYVFKPAGGETAFYVDNSGAKVGIGISNPDAKLDVIGDIKLGDRQATSGTVLLKSHYGTTNPETLNVIGTQYADGNTLITYGLSPTPGIRGYQSTSSIGTGQPRAVLEIGLSGSPIYSGLILRTTTSTNAALGSAVPTEETFSVTRNSLGYSGSGARFDMGGGNQVKLVSRTANDSVELAWWENASKSWVLDGGSANGTFRIRDDYQAGTPTRFSINNQGKVGIGTALQTAQLQIDGADGTQQGLFVNINGTDADTVSNNLSTMWTKSTVHVKVAGTSTTRLLFGGVGGSIPGIQSSNSNGAAAFSMSIQPYGGNVGIGTTAPDNTLTVIGGVKIAPIGTSITGAFFTHPQFNSCSVTNITSNTILNSSTFAQFGSPSSVYTIDPGEGISINSGVVLQIGSGFVWKII